MVDAAVRAEVLECYAAYAHCLDDGRIDEWVECFTADGRLETTRPLVVQGRKNLAEFGRLWLSAQAGPTRHCSWHHELLDVDGLVHGRCSVALLQTTASGVTVAFTGTYRDMFAHDEGRWRIQERHVTIDVAPAPVHLPAGHLRSVP
jgi:3-phenylpropionate/cinnamic acid dioxygenase small subunit